MEIAIASFVSVRLSVRHFHTPERSLRELSRFHTFRINAFKLGEIFQTKYAFDSVGTR